MWTVGCIFYQRKRRQQEALIEKRQTSTSSAILREMLCQEILHIDSHVDVTMTRAPYLYIVVRHRRPVMAEVFSQCGGLSHPATKTVQECFEEHDKVLKVLTWPPNSPDLNPIVHLWDVLDKQAQSTETSAHNLQDLKDLLLMYWRLIPQELVYSEVLWSPCRNRSELF